MCECSANDTVQLLSAHHQLNSNKQLQQQHSNVDWQRRAAAPTHTQVYLLVTVTGLR